ncbi:MAG: rod shape-determining protein MreC [Bacteroidetes bacterium]|nr:rod shape-determining protein MreC [Bacteroidota bacterium]
MRNIFIFIRVYFNFLFFLFLMGVSLYMLFAYNKYHQTVYSAVANEATGALSTQYNKVQYYFQLKRTNDSLVKANENLYNKLKADFELPDSTSNKVVDSLKNDTIPSARKYLYLSAKVVRNSVNQQNNYIIVHRGALQGIAADMGVIAPNNAVIGSVMEVSGNYAVIMSLLHEQSNLSARLKNSGETGTVVWDGISSKIILLKDISKSVKISAGDTVVTSGFSDKFPSGLLVGYVKDIINDKSSSTYTIRLTPAANFQNLQFAYIIKNFQADEPSQLLKKVKNK